MNNIWQLQHAKSKFSEVVERTLVDGAQIVTCRGRKTVVILPFEEYVRLVKPADSLAQFLLASPLLGSELTIKRDKRPHAILILSHELLARYRRSLRIYTPPAGTACG
jgi:antitoxin Phd